jgi:hypothetical protein
MALIVHIVMSGISREQYDATRVKVGWLDTPPDGGKCHLTWWEGDECHNIDAWEDEAALAKFGEDRLGPAMAALGIQAEVQPTFHPAYEVFMPKALTLLGS